MAKKTALIYTLVFLLSFICVCPNVVNAENTEPGTEAAEFGNYGGALLMDEEQIAEFEANTPRIVDVKLNANGLNVIQENNSEIELFENIEPVPFGQETITDEDIELMSENTNYPLPSSYDVSQNDSFPPIKNQGNINSCIGWSLCYYQLTNNIANIRGYNAKSDNAEQYWMSPMWLYNLINGGKNIDTNIYDGLDCLYSFGCANWDDCPGSAKIDDIVSWHPDADLWESALANKAFNEYIKLNTEEDIKNLKKLLINGYVVSFHTQMASGLSNWKIKNSDNALSEKVCYYATTAEKGHFLTIVGYNDNIWVDVNGNDIKDNGETGAFKIANSWGDNYGNDGYMWFLYDAINENTTIPNVLNQKNRTPLISNNSVVYLEPYEQYTPLLLAEVSIKTKNRGQLIVSTGISETDDENPQRETTITNLEYNTFYASCNRFYDARDELNFEGKNESETGTFIFDLTPIADQYYSKMTAQKKYRFYIKLEDIIDDKFESQLIDFKIIDRYNNTISSSKDAFPLTVNGSSCTAYADCLVVPKLVTSKKMFEIRFNNSVNEDTITNSNIFVNDSDNNLIDTKVTTRPITNDYIYVHPPTEGYKIAHFYSLHINDSIRSVGGNKLLTPKERLFYIIRKK